MRSHGFAKAVAVFWAACRHRRLAAALGLLLAAVPQAARAVTVAPGEMAEARRFAAAMFEGAAVSGAVDPGLEVVANYDLVQTQRPVRQAAEARRREAHARGLFCHADEQDRRAAAGAGQDVRGPGGRRQQRADRRRPRQRRVHASRSAARRRSAPRCSAKGCRRCPCKVDLGGATEFVLAVSDGGRRDSPATRPTGPTPGSRWPTARRVWLDELPVAGGPAVIDAGEPPLLVHLRRASRRRSCSKTGRSSGRRSRSTTQRTERTLDVHRPEDRPRGPRASPSSTATSRRSSGRCTSRTPATADTPILENIQALDLQFARGALRRVPAAPRGGQPLRGERLRAAGDGAARPDATKRIGAAGGRPTNSDLSYFNLEVPTGSRRDRRRRLAGPVVVDAGPATTDVGLRVRAGQELTHFKLLPGEEIRTPADRRRSSGPGDWIRAQNVWRRWMLAHNVPKPGRQAARSRSCSAAARTCSARWSTANEENQKMCIDRYLAEGIPIDHWWMDAGWYPCAAVGWPQDRHLGGRYRSDSPAACGRSATTPTPRASRRSSGSSRSGSTPDTWLTKNHPEWILGGAAAGCLNLGNPEARQWLTDHVDQLLTDEGIDLYRQDFNMDPLGHWRGADAAGPPGHHRDPPRRGLSGLLGRVAAPASRHVHRHVRLRRAAQRPGDAAPRDPAVADRLPLRADRHAVLHATAFRCGFRFPARAPPTSTPTSSAATWRPSPTACSTSATQTLDYDTACAACVGQWRSDRRLLLRRFLSADGVQHRPRTPGWRGSSTGRRRARAWSRRSAARSASSRSAG